MWLHNRLNESLITIYNETLTRGTGGLLQTETTDEVELYVVWIRTPNKYRVKDKGSYIYEKAIFQVSMKELEDNSFTITPGITTVEKDGFKYKVENILDFGLDDYLQLKEVSVQRKYDANTLEAV